MNDESSSYPKPHPGSRSSPQSLASLLPLALGMARRFRLSQEDVEDLAQEVLLQLLINRCPVREPRLWIWTAMVHLVGKIRTRPEELVGLPEDVPAGVGDPAAALDLELDFKLLLDRLKPPARRILELVAEGRSHREIAKALGCPVNQVGKKLARAIRQARRLVEGDAV